MLKLAQRWDAGAPSCWRSEEALADAIDRSQIDAAWYGSALDSIRVTGNSAIRLHRAAARRHPGRPLENMCATGTKTLRGAAYAVASGACDIALAIGAGELEGHRLRRVRSRTRARSTAWLHWLSPPASRSSPAAIAQRRLKEDLKQAISVSWEKLHQNGQFSPKAHLRKPVWRLKTRS
ncbi:hypothetical protein AB5I41_08560 [Sphingomonas sp. MMS24-JH45]